MDNYKLLAKFINTALDDDYGISHESFLYLLDYITAIESEEVAQEVNRTVQVQDGRVYLNQGNWIGDF